MINIEVPNFEFQSPVISIIGVGGAGCNVLNRMIESIPASDSMRLIAMNTDSKSLMMSNAIHKVQLGANGLGAGSLPVIGREAAEASRDEIWMQIEGSDIVFVVAGMGGGTGTGAAPVIAKIAKDKEILTVGIITKPFLFEGKHRMKMANSGVEELCSNSDTVIPITNQNLFKVVDDSTTFVDAFRVVDDVVSLGIKGITDLISQNGTINLDFADVATVMRGGGKAVIGVGESDGDDRAMNAARSAMSNQLLDDASIKGAKGVLINVTGGSDIRLFEIDQAINLIKDEISEDANIIFGSVTDNDMQGFIRISIVATGVHPKADQIIDARQHKIDSLDTYHVDKIHEEQCSKIETQAKRRSMDIPAFLRRNLRFQDAL